MSGNSFINPLRSDRLDDEFATDEELATAIATRVATATYNSGVSALNTTINNKADQTAVNAALALKQGLAPENDSYALTNSVNASLNTKQANPPGNDSFVLTTVMNAGMANKQDLAPEGDSYALTNSVNTSLQSKQDIPPEDDSFVLTTAMTAGMANKQDIPPENDSFVLTTTMDTGLATKQDLAPTGDSYALTNSVNTSLNEKQGKPPVGDSFVLNTAMNTAISGKQDIPSDPNDSFVLNSNMNAALNNKVDNPGENDSFVLNSDLIGELNDYATNTALTDGLATKQATGNYALQEDIPALAGGYSVGAVDNLLALKADKSELVYRETGEVDANGDLVLDANGNPVRDPTYTLNQTQLGAKLKAMDDTTNGKQNAGDYITRSEAQQGDASASIGGAIAGGLLGTASVVWSGVTSGGQTVTKTVGDVFKDIGDAFGDGDGGDAPPAINYNTFVTKPGDWLSTPGVFLPADDLSLYTARKAKNTPTLESDNLQIKSSSVFLKSGLLDTPRAGYKLDVGGSVYVDGELNAGSITCPDINGEVFKVQNDTDNSFFKAKHDGNLIRFTKHNNTIDVNQNIGTAEAPEYNTEQVVGNDIMNMNLVDGKVKIPGALQVLGSLTNATGASYALQSAVDSLNFTTIENVDNLIDTRLQHQGLMDDNLQTLVYDKEEVDALIPDVSEYETTTQLDTRFSTYETTTQLDTRFTDFRTASDAVYQPIALPDNPYVLQSVLDIGLAGYQPTPPDGDTFALTSALPDVSVFNTSTEVDTKITTSLNSYDTSTEVNNKISTGLNSYDTSTEVDSKVSTALTSYDTSLENDTKIAGALLNYNTSTEVDNKISTSLNSYDTSTEVDSKILNAGVGGHWVKDGTTNNLSYTTADVAIGRATPSETLDILGSMRVGEGDAMLVINQRTNSGYDNTPRPETVGLQTLIDGRTLEQGASYGQEPRVALALQPDYGYVGIGKVDPLAKLDVNGYIHSGNGITSRTYFHHSDNIKDMSNGAGHGKMRLMMNALNPSQVYHGNEYGMELGVSGTGNSTIQSIGYTHNTGITSAVYHLHLQPWGGRVGIGLGVGTPNAPLEVQEMLSRSVGEGFREYGMFSQGGYSPDTTLGIAIDAYSGVVASAFYARSDERIKENIVDVNDNEALDLLRLLKPKTYEYKDKVQKGSKKVFGFIAQDIKSVLPECISTRVEGIPNILEVAKFDLLNKSNVITFTKFDTSNLVSNTSTLNVYGATGGLHKVNVLEVINNKSIKIDTDLSKFVGSFDDTDNLITETTTTTLSLEEYEVLEDKEGYVEEANTYIKTTITNVGNSILVHGEMVDDFLSVELDYLWTIATSALQEVDRQLQSEKAKVASLEARLSALEEKI